MNVSYVSCILRITLTNVCLNLAVCMDLPMISNGSISYIPADEPRRTGTIAMYSCLPGYMLVGPDRRVCERISGAIFDRADWNRSEPQCNGKLLIKLFLKHLVCLLLWTV